MSLLKQNRQIEQNLTRPVQRFQRGKNRNSMSRSAPRRTNSRLKLTNAISCHHQRVISKNPKQVVSDNADTDTRNDDHTVREIVTVRTHCDSQLRIWCSSQVQH